MAWTPHHNDRRRFYRPFVWLWPRVISVIDVLRRWTVGVRHVIRSWYSEWCRRLRLSSGYITFFSTLGAGIALYTIFEAQHGRQVNRALFEREIFMTMVTSEKPEAFIAAMKQFGPIQTMRVRAEPVLWLPWRWMTREQPNLAPLWQWAFHVLPSCTPSLCSSPKDVGNDLRIDLGGANLEGAKLDKVQLGRAYLRDAKLGKAYLKGADLLGAYLEGADLEGANLEGATMSDTHMEAVTLRGALLYGAVLSEADLRGAILYGADLRDAGLHKVQLQSTDLPKVNLKGAPLEGANLSKADLRRTKSLTQAQLNTTCLSSTTKLPKHLSCYGQGKMDTELSDFLQ